MKMFQCHEGLWSWCLPLQMLVWVNTLKVRNEMPTSATKKSEALIAFSLDWERELLLSPGPRRATTQKEWSVWITDHNEREKRKRWFCFSLDTLQNWFSGCVFFLFYHMIIWKSLTALHTQEISKGLLTVVTALTKHSFLTTSVERHTWQLQPVPRRRHADPEEIWAQQTTGAGP